MDSLLMAATEERLFQIFVLKYAIDLQKGKDWVSI